MIEEKEVLYSSPDYRYFSVQLLEPTNVEEDIKKKFGTCIMYLLVVA